MSNLLEPSSVNSDDFLSLFMIIELAIFVMEFQTFLSSWFGSKEDDDHWLSEILGRERKLLFPSPLTADNTAAAILKHLNISFLGRSDALAVEWIKMRGCIVCGEPASQRCGGCANVSYCSVAHQVINGIDNLHIIEQFLSSRKNTGRHTSLLAHPARLWRARYKPKI